MTKTKSILIADETFGSDEELTEESDIEDDNICSSIELDQYFQQKYSIHDELAVTLKKNYILSLAKDDSLTLLVAGLSNGSVHLFDVGSECNMSHSTMDCVTAPSIVDPSNSSSICGLRFVDETPNLLLVGTTDGLIRLFDFRIQSQVACFQNDPEADVEPASMPKNIVCFDRNSNSRVLCAGSEQHNYNVFLLFYDMRERKQMGAYFYSHQDDVTTLRFHPHNPDILCSGSTDGLINIFDLQKNSEDDALTTTINTVSSVHRVNWHKNVYNKDIISCITHTNDLKLYECEGNSVAAFERPKITECIKRKSAANCNLIDCHSLANGEISLLTGSNLNKGEVMRSLIVQNQQLLPGFEFQGNKQIVRASTFDVDKNVFITAGESGIVTLWKPHIATNSGVANFKAKSKRSIKSTPY